MILDFTRPMHKIRLTAIGRWPMDHLHLSDLAAHCANAEQ